MKLLVRSICLSSLFLVNVLAQGPVNVLEVGQDHFEADFPSGGQIRMRIRSGAIKIMGSDEKKIQVHYSGKNADQRKDVRVSLENQRGGGRTEHQRGATQ